MFYIVKSALYYLNFPVNHSFFSLFCGCGAVPAAAAALIPNVKVTTSNTTTIGNVCIRFNPNQNII